MRVPAPPTLTVPVWKAEYARVGLASALVWPPTRRPPRDGGRLHLTTGGKARVPVFPESLSPITVYPTRLIFVPPCFLVDAKPRLLHLLVESTGYAYLAHRAPGKWFPDGRPRWLEHIDALGVELTWRYPNAVGAGSLDTWVVHWPSPVLRDTHEYGERYGPCIHRGWFRSAISDAGLPPRDQDDDDGGLPPDLPDALRDALA